MVTQGHRGRWHSLTLVAAWHGEKEQLKKKKRALGVYFFSKILKVNEERRATYTPSIPPRNHLLILLGAVIQSN